MNPITRRDFVGKSLLLAGGLSVLSFKGFKASKAKLSFSTLGCPKWDLRTVVEFAARHGYQGLEFRGLNGEIDLRKVAAFSPSEIASTKRLLADNNVKVVNLGSSAHMHHRDEATRTKHLDEAKAYIDLAQKLDCPFVRVFPEKLEEDREGSKKQIAASLLQLGEYAKATNVSVLLESHGSLVYKKDVADVMNASKHKNVGLIWDILNMWSVSKESPAELYPALAPFIRHVHLKDGVVTGDHKINYVLLGKGDAPLKEAFDQLKKNKYNGYYSFEWEKLWHPEIAEPEVALADYPKAVMQYLK